MRGQTMKGIEVLLSIVLVGLGAYFIYRVVSGHETQIYIIILDIVMALYMFWVIIEGILQGKKTDVERIEEWRTKVKPKGFLYFYIKNELIQSAIPWGIFLWLVPPMRHGSPVIILFFVAVFAYRGYSRAREEWKNKNTDLLLAKLDKKVR